MIKVEIGSSVIPDWLTEGNKINALKVTEGLPDDCELVSAEVDKAITPPVLILHFDNGEDGVIEQEVVMRTKHPAAGPWQDPNPDEAGRYLVEYEQHNQRSVFVGDYRYSDEREEWYWSMMEKAEVLRYAEIDSTYVRRPSNA